LINFLLCPACRHSINIKIKKKIHEEIIEETMICDHCKHNFKTTSGNISKEIKKWFKELKLTNFKEIKSKITVSGHKFKKKIYLINYEI
jgi:C4-type Zn-finger protein